MRKTYLFSELKVKFAFFVFYEIFFEQDARHETSNANVAKKKNENIARNRDFEQCCHKKNWLNTNSKINRNYIYIQWRQEICINLLMHKIQNTQQEAQTSSDAKRENHSYDQFQRKKNKKSHQTKRNILIWYYQWKAQIIEIWNIVIKFYHAKCFITFERDLMIVLNVKNRKQTTLYIQNY